MTFEMIDSKKRQTVDQSNGLGCHHADNHAPDQTGPGGHSNGIKITKRPPPPFHGRLYNRVNMVKMGARRNFRDDPPRTSDVHQTGLKRFRRVYDDPGRQPHPRRPLLFHHSLFQSLIHARLQLYPSFTINQPLQHHAYEDQSENQNRYSWKSFSLGPGPFGP